MVGFAIVGISLEETAVYLYYNGTTSPAIVGKRYVSTIDVIFGEKAICPFAHPMSVLRQHPHSRPRVVGGAEQYDF